MDSYFASVEQYLQPELRGRPMAVAPMLVDSTSCIAASYEAKAYGIKTGTGVGEAKQRCPEIVVVEARPPLYVEIHHEIVELIDGCLPVSHVLSIDEMLCELALNRRELGQIDGVVSEIKRRLSAQYEGAIGVSVGVASNGWLAKMASKMRKPNGYVVLHPEDLPEALYELTLGDLHGVGKSMLLRLHAHGIHDLEQLCAAPKSLLRRIWNGVLGERMWHQLRGDAVQVEANGAQKRSMSHGHVLPPEWRAPGRAEAVMHRLTQKVGKRLRDAGLKAGGLHLHLRWLHGREWGAAASFAENSDSLELTHWVQHLWRQRPWLREPVLKINVELTQLVDETQYTPSLLEWRGETRDELNRKMDEITARYGKKALYLGGAHGALETSQPKIAFQHIPELGLEGAGTRQVPRRVVTDDETKESDDC